MLAPHPVRIRTSSQPPRARPSDADEYKARIHASATATEPCLDPPSPFQLKPSSSLLSLASPRSARKFKFPRKRTTSLSAQNSPESHDPIVQDRAHAQHAHPHAPPPRPLRNPARSKLAATQRPSTAPGNTSSKPLTVPIAVTSPSSPASVLPVR